MSDRLKQTEEIVTALVALMKKHGALITLDPTVHAIQVVYLPEDMIGKSADAVAKRFMYNVIMEGEIGFSPAIQEQLGLDEPITQVPMEDVEQVRKMMDYARYFQEDNNPDWLKDLGISEDDLEDD